jgi:hypothetical protein
MCVYHMYTLETTEPTDQKEPSAYDLLHAELKQHAKKAHHFQKQDISYQEEVDNYTHVGSCDFYIVWNKQEPMEQHDVREILFAMANHKPIILLEVPAFDSSVRLFGRQLIEKNLNKFLLCDITMLDASDLGDFMQNIAGHKTHYALTQHDEVLIKADVKEYFRALL